jgi:hypothetical protein
MDEVRAATCVRIALPLCTHTVEEGALSPFAPPCSPTRRRTYTPLPACRTQLPVTPAQRPRSTGAHRVSKECGAHALCCHTPPRQGHTAVLTHRPDVCRRVRRYSGEVCELLRSTHRGRGDLSSQCQSLSCLATAFAQPLSHSPHLCLDDDVLPANRPEQRTRTAHVRVTRQPLL